MRAAAEAKAVRKAAEEAGREAAASRKHAEAKARAEEAAARVAAFGPPPPILPGSTVLPAHVWTSVLESLGRRPNAVYDACLCARDVCNAALVCRDLRVAAREVLSSPSSPLLASLPAPDPKLCTAVYEPGRLTKPELKGVCSGLGVAVGGNKPELVVRVLDALGLDRASPGAPVALLVEARRQRGALWWRDEAGLSRFRSASVHPIRTMSTWRFRRFMIDRFACGGDGARIERMSCGRCVQCGAAPFDARCVTLSCQECCLEGQKGPCPIHRIFCPASTAVVRACVRCGRNEYSPACSAHMCGLCCPRNGCTRHS